MLAMANIETWPVPKHLGSPLMKVIQKGSKHRNARKTPDIIAQVKFKSSYIFFIHSTWNKNQALPYMSIPEGRCVTQYPPDPPAPADPGVCWYFMHNFAGSLTALLYTGLKSFCSREVYVHFCQRSEKGWRGSTWGASSRAGRCPFLSLPLSFVFTFVSVIVFLLVKSCLLVTLITYLKGHKSLRVLYGSVF